MQRLGQHFLKNKGAIKKIVAALDLRPGDMVVEIGAGHGELTEVLLNAERKVRIVAIEKDLELVNFLRKKFLSDKNMEIIEGDALKIIPELDRGRFATSGKQFAIAGNIPYYLSGKLLRLIGELRIKPAVCVLTLQREVAERIAAEPPRMNRLAASIQFWAEPEILGYIPKKDFAPPPEVDSAMIRLKVKSGKLKVGAENYYKTVRILFQQPRKTILNNLASGIKCRASKNKETGHERGKIAEKLLKIYINPHNRPQNLSVEDIVRISNIVW